MNVPEEVVEAMAREIDREAFGWDDQTARTRARRTAHAALLNAASLGWVMVPTRGAEFEAMVERMGDAIHARKGMRAALRAAVAAQGEN